MISVSTEKKCDSLVKRNNDILLSVIVPVYNCEKYLDECLSSLTRQGLNDKEYEVLIVNDGSTDKSAEIALSYCEKYHNFYLLNQENQGVSAARNKGLDSACGKYIAFVDSDDYVADNLYLNVVSLIRKRNFKTFYFGSTSSQDKLESFNGEYYIPPKEYSCKMPVWRYLFSNEIIQKYNLRFSVGVKFCEDFLFNYKYIQLSNSAVAATAQCLYYYRIFGESATAKVRLRDDSVWKIYYESYLFVVGEIKRFTLENQKPLDGLYYNSISAVIQEMLWGCFIFKKSPLKAIAELKDKGVSLEDNKFKRPYGDSFKYKFKTWLTYNFRHKFVFIFTCFIYRLIGK
ncbi:glycosyltransferase [Fibrobacter succinogenes]|uniref:glycosyltransferase n=1 Tax=Fibrobacter succinogenes TaxID=833 RepID=UPI00156A13B7|nr:glycosyltransferase [Fibrobacter succinogenes]